MMSIENKLEQAWRQQQWYYNVRGFSRFLIWLVFLLALDFIIDWGILFQVRMTARVGWVLLASNLIVLTWVLWTEWLRHLKRYDPLLVALEVEAQHPELASLLVSYTQLKDSSHEANFSPELLAAMREDAVLQTSKVDFREIVDFGQIQNLLMVAVVVLAGAALAGYSGQDHVSVLFQRLAGYEKDYPTQTQVVDVSEDLVAQAGGSVTVTADATGVIPNQGRLFVRPASGGAWKSLPLKQSASQSSSDTIAYDRQLDGLTGDMSYYVRVGDAVSEVYRIRVVPPPQIAAVDVTLKYPPYMKREDRQVEQLNLEVPVGTDINYRLTTSAAVKSMVVHTTRVNGEGQEVLVPGTVNADGDEVSFTLAAEEGFKYTFLWTVREQDQDFEYDDVQHSIRVVADGLPEVQMQSPRLDGLATAKKEIRLSATAQDDYGLGQAWLVYRINEGEEQRQLIHSFDGARTQEFRHEWLPRDTISELDAGTRLAVSIEVNDLNTAGVRTRRSATRRFTFVDEADYLKWQQGELAAQRDEIKRVRDRELAAQLAVKQLKAQENEGTSGNDE